MCQGRIIDVVLCSRYGIVAKKNSMVVVIGSKCEVVSDSVGRMKDANAFF